MKSAPALPHKAISGLMDIGPLRVVTTSGFRAAGSNHLMKVHTGAIRTMTMKDRAGGCMKVTGIVRIMAIVTITTIMTTVITGIAITATNVRSS